LTEEKKREPYRMIGQHRAVTVDNHDFCKGGRKIWRLDRL